MRVQIDARVAYHQVKFLKERSVVSTHVRFQRQYRIPAAKTRRRPQSDAGRVLVRMPNGVLGQTEHQHGSGGKRGIEFWLGA